MYKPLPRYHRIDGWRGYSIPASAVAGASDTGMWSDSPCPSGEVKDEINEFRRKVLRPAGIASRVRTGASSNVFCGKRWVCVAKEDFDRAARLTVEYVEKNDRELRYLHDADLEKVDFREVP